MGDGARPTDVAAVDDAPALEGSRGGGRTNGRHIQARSCPRVVGRAGAGVGGGARAIVPVAVRLVHTPCRAAARGRRPASPAVAAPRRAGAGGVVGAALVLEG